MPTPEDIMAAMRGGGREGSSRGRPSRSSQQQQADSMTIGVDPRSNSLIVSASTTLYEQVRALVEELDAVVGEVAADEATEVIALERISPTAMKSALTTIMGDSAVVTSSSSGSSRERFDEPSFRPDRPLRLAVGNAGNVRRMRRRIEPSARCRGKAEGPDVWPAGRIRRTRRRRRAIEPLRKRSRTSRLISEFIGPQSRHSNNAASVVVNTAPTSPSAEARSPDPPHGAIRPRLRRHTPASHRSTGPAPSARRRREPRCRQQGSCGFPARPAG